MFKKKSTQEQMEERIKQFEKETLERGLVEHLPPAEVGMQQASAATTSDVLNIFKRLRRGNGAMRILIIDDEVPFRMMLRQFLENYGFEVVEAANGEEGVKNSAQGFTRTEAEG